MSLKSEGEELEVAFSTDHLKITYLPRVHVHAQLPRALS